MAWSTGWPVSGVSPQNLKYSACRPATVLKNIHDNINPSGKPFCAQGSSGGGAAIMFSLTAYGLDSVITAALVSGGPSYSGVVAECIYPPLADITVCPTGQTYCTQTSLSFSNNPAFPSCSHADTVNYACNCAPTSTQPKIDSWNGQSSVVGTQVNTNFPNTYITTWTCSSVSNGGTLNNTPSQAQLLAQTITAKNTVTMYLVQNCSAAESYVTSIINANYNQDVGWRY